MYLMKIYHLEWNYKKRNGYVTAEENRNEDGIGMIPVDSIYSPVTCFI